MRREKMTSRERILRTLNHQIPDRVPIEDSPWSSAIQRWHKEGLPEDTSPAEHFGYEMANFGADTSPRFPVKVLEKNEEYIITTTPQGGKRKNHRDYSTTPEIIDWPIKTKDDWKEMKKKLKPDFTRVDWASGLAGNKTAREEGKFVCFCGGYGYDILQSYLKSEQLLITMVEDPAWIKDMVMTFAELTLVMAELMMSNGFKFDGAFIYNDMGYKNGLLFSPDTYNKTHYEADKLVFGYFHSKGMKTILHSCGNVEELIPVLIEVGLDCLQPLEVKAGMDLIKLKEKYGDKLSFMGGIDVRNMADPDTAKIEEEIKKKFEVAKKNGGYIYHSDHSIPKNVSFQQYCHVMELVKKYGVYEEYKPELPKIEKPSAPPVKPEQKPPEKKKKKFKLFGKKTPAPQTEKPQVEPPVKPEKTTPEIPIAPPQTKKPQVEPPVKPEKTTPEIPIAPPQIKKLPVEPEKTSQKPPPPALKIQTPLDTAEKKPFPTPETQTPPATAEKKPIVPLKQEIPEVKIREKPPKAKIPSLEAEQKPPVPPEEKEKEKEEKEK